MSRVVVYLAFAAELWSFARAADGNPQGETRNAEKRISFSADGGSTLQVLIQLGFEEHLPLGIVLDRTGKLCGLSKPMAATDTTPRKIVNTLLSHTGYSSLIRDGVIEVRPKQIPEQAQRVLDIKFARFDSIHTTIQGMGVVLFGQIFAHFHRRQGYALDILSSPDAEKVPLFTLSNVATEQILNHIVSTGSKGVWILSPPAGSGKGQYDRLEVYGYRDDAMALNRLSCFAAPGDHEM